MKLRKSKLSAERIIDMYTHQNMTMQHIADRAGVTRQAIKLVLDRHSVEYRGGAQERVCLFCGEKFQATRCRIKRGGGGYCSPQCFHADRSIAGEYSIIGGAVTRLEKSLGITDRQLGRRARNTITGLKPGQVVHHIDGDRTNNDPANLMVFDSHAEHMMFHHQLRREKRGG